jgi:RNA ligase (TIGR02306 family)
MPMSDPIVLLTKIDEIHPHQGADKLELAYVNGTQYIVGKGEFEEGDPCLIIGPNCVLPDRIKDDLGLESNRVKVVKLRGEVSNGLCIRVDKMDLWGNPMVVFDILDPTGPARWLGITKYEPPVRYEGPSAVSLPTTFQKYTDIENIAKWPNIFEPGERVWVSEKIDGQNFRIGVFLEDGKVFFKAGSHHQDRAVGQPHWKCFPMVAHFLTRKVSEAVQRGASRYSLILYGELYGSMHGGYKAMNYGSPYEVRFSFYDLCENEIYWDKDVMLEEFEAQDFPTPYGKWLDFDPNDLTALARLSSEVSTVAGSLKEGVVITPKCERADPRLGRVILKAVNPEYLILKGNFDVRDS